MRKDSKYRYTEEAGERLAKVFEYHSPKEDQPERYGELRAAAKELSIMVLRYTPPSREQSLALTKLEEAIMFANAAIARNE